MTKVFSAGAALLLTTSMAQAIGLDRSGQNIGLIFEDGNYAELSFGSTTPSATGTDEAVFGGFASGNVAQDFSQVAAGVKVEVKLNLSISVIFDQPFGTDVDYPVFDPSTGSGSTALGGTAATVDSSALTAIARYQFNDNFSVHAGIRRQTISADVTLAGAAYGGLSGYNAAFDDDTQVGYLAGVAYERPEIALRVALTYFSAVDHELSTTETLNGAPLSAGPSVTDVTTPEAWNLDFRTGVAEDTLVFGSIRWADYESTIVSPTVFAAQTGGASLTDIENKAEYSIGVARRFSDSFVGTVAVGFEPEGEDDLVSPLSPTNGRRSLQLGAIYSGIDNVTISGGVRYTWLGDAQPETGTPDVARASFTDNDALSIGLKVGFSF